MSAMSLFESWEWRCIKATINNNNVPTEASVPKESSEIWSLLKGKTKQEKMQKQKQQQKSKQTELLSMN